MSEGGPEGVLARCIFADPSWLYANYGQKKHGAARAHYAGMTMEQLAAIPVARWSADDAVLVLWATFPKLIEALAVVRRWGFNYVTAFPWVKTTPSAGEIRCGIGFWAQATAELVIVARKGSLRRLPGAPHVRGLMVGEAQGTRGAGEGLFGALERGRVFYAPRGVHSVKPLEIQGWLERTVPGPRLELFGRVERKGWLVLGLELGWRLGSWGARRCRPVRSLPKKKER